MSENESIRILVCDDDRDFQKLVVDLLKFSGFTNVDPTDDPYYSLEKIEEGEVDLVLLDWWLPELQGLDLVRAVRNKENMVPIIMITSDTKREHVDLAMEAGVSDYIDKAHTTVKLIPRIHRLLNALRK